MTGANHELAILEPILKRRTQLATVANRVAAESDSETMNLGSERR